jgi:exopolysaccharide production protein ExoZ
MTEAPASPPARIVSIQHLRALAAIAVLAFHAAQRSHLSFPVGALGVDIFFVISGFVMWSIAGRGQTRPGTFLLNRIRRIVPQYWIATAVMISGALAGLFPNMELTATHIVASLFFIPHVSPSNGHVWPVLVQGWTLDLEMFFYLLFAILLPLPHRIRLASLCGILALAVAAGLLWSPQLPTLQAYSSPLLLEFAAGTVIGEAWLRGRMPSRAASAFAVLLGIMGFAAFQFGWLPQTPGAAGPAAVLLVIGALGLERSGAVLRVPLISYLGDASYSIYLWHALGVSIALKLVASHPVPSLFALSIAVAAGMLLGCGLYELIEKPLLRRLRRKRPSPVIGEAAPAIL